MKIGLLGLGSIGMRHARNLRMLGHEVIGYDSEDKKMKEFQGKLYARDDIIANSAAIIIATPTVNHYSDIQACIGAAKSFFIEKPVARTREEYELLSRQPNVNYAMVGYMLRFHPCVKAAKQWIDNGNIGKPLWAQFTCGQFNDKMQYLRDGVVLNWSHEIDLALYLLGPAKVLTASVGVSYAVPWGAMKGNDNIADIILEHESGARSTIHLDYVTKNEIREGWIVGDEKNIGMDLLGRRNSMGKVIQEFGGDWNADYIDEMADFIMAVEAHLERFPYPSPRATGEDGLRVLEICHEVRKLAGLDE